MKYNQQELEIICNLCRKEIIQLQEKYKYNSDQLNADQRYTTLYSIIDKCGITLRNIHYPQYHVEKVTEHDDN